MIRRVAVVPHPPLLVPELVPGAERETAGVRDAVTEAVAWLREVSEHWVAVGAHDGPAARVEPTACGSFAGYGVDLPVSLSRTPDDRTPTGRRTDLPLPVLVAGWLRARVDAATVRVELIGAGLPPAQCRTLGQRLAAGEGTALLVLGDGSNRHGERAPARPDARAPRFDATVAAALADADADALASVDATVAAELGAVGRAPWQVAAGVVERGRWRGKLLYSDAPFGVGYHVATWERG